MFNPVQFYEFGKSRYERIPELIAWYDFESSAIDSSANALNGSIVGTPTFVSGKVSNAINFQNNTTLNYVNIADSDKLSFTDQLGDTPFSISLWVNFTAISTGTNSGNWFMSKRGATIGTDEWQFCYFNNVSGFTPGIYFMKYDKSTSGLQYIGFTFTPTLNTWYHLVYTDDGSKTTAGMKLYLDNLPQSSTGVTSGVYTGMPNGSSITRIGNASWSAGSPQKHKGLIDSLGIYKNLVLNSTEISQLYNSGNGMAYPPPFSPT